jgi:hypothetical protein
MPIRSPILLLVPAFLVATGCRRGSAPPAPVDTPQSSELKLLERQVDALKGAVSDARQGTLFPVDEIAVGVSEEVVRAAVSQALPIEKTVASRFRARIDRAIVSFRSMQGSVRLEGRIWALDEPGTFADLVLLGGIQDLEIEKETGVLKAEIVLDGWEPIRVATMGAEAEWIKELVRLLGARGLAALRELAPPVRIPVGIERGIDLPGVSGGAVTIPSGHLPLEARVSKVLPLSGRLWALINVRTTGWQRSGDGGVR